MTSDNQPQGYYVDIRTIPVPAGHRPLEYDRDGNLLFAWDTNALDHSRWPIEDFEEAVLTSVREFGTPNNLDDLTVLAAARRAKVYNYWHDRGGWEFYRDAKARLFAAAEATARSKLLLAPIQGVSLNEYAQVQVKTAEGVDRAVTLTALNIDPSVWAEASEGWLYRIRFDSTGFLSSEFSRLYQGGITDARLQAVSVTPRSTDEANLQRLRDDRTFFVEVAAARSAVYGAGLDGNAWMMDVFGVAPADFQAIGDGYNAQSAGTSDLPSVLPVDAVQDNEAERWRQLSLRAVAGDQSARDYIREHMQGAQNWSTLQNAFYDAYVQRFNAQIGGGVADDIEF